MKIIAICGKSGSGKDTLLNKILEKYPAYFHKIISCTTRPQRFGEVDGVDYYFLSKNEFINDMDDMLDTNKFNDWFYGARRKDLVDDKINIGIFSPRAILDIMSWKNLDIDLKVYYLRASDKMRLIRQLNREVDPDVQEIVRRFSADENDFKVMEQIDYIGLESLNPDYIRFNADLIFGQNCLNI